MSLLPPGAVLSPSGMVVMAPCGRRGLILRRERPRGRCTWCGGPVAPPRRTWCGPECVRIYQATQPATLHTLVFQRDGEGPCEVCGQPGGARELDHRVPIIEGGHPFDLDNLRLIHPHCHRHETAALAGRRAARRVA